MIAAIKRLLTTRRALQSDTIDSLRRDVIRLHTAKLAAEKQVELTEEHYRNVFEANIKLAVELNAIKRARSDAVAKGNTTRRLKREAAAKVSA